jgi:hypothetical protein
MAPSTLEKPGPVRIREFGYETPRSRTLLARARGIDLASAGRALLPVGALAAPRIIAAGGKLFNRLVRRDASLGLAILAGGLALASARRSR